MPTTRRTRRAPRPRRYGSAADARLLAQAREVLEMTQEGMGAALSMTQGAISQVESGLRALSELARGELNRLLAIRNAERLMETSTVHELRCVRTEDAAFAMRDYLSHLDTCAPCLARAAIQWDISGR